MQTIPKCLLLPIDGTNESVRPARFLGRLYPPSELRLILCHFSAPPPPAYSGEVAVSRAMLAKRRQFFEQLKRKERSVFDHALEALAKEGFSKEFIQEHVAQKTMSVAKQACLLGEIRKVDAIVVPKQVKSRLEDLMSPDSSSALVQHCLECPIWLTEGEPDPKKAALYITEEQASLRIADHAGYMLAGTGIDIALIGAAPKIELPLSRHLSQAVSELGGYADQRQVSSFLRAAAKLVDNGIGEDRIRITLLPRKGHSATQILSWCASNGIAIIGLGRTRPEGMLGFPRRSAYRQIASSFKNMAVWVA